MRVLVHYAHNDTASWFPSTIIAEMELNSGGKIVMPNDKLYSTACKLADEEYAHLRNVVTSISTNVGA